MSSKSGDFTPCLARTLAPGAKRGVLWRFSGTVMTLTPAVSEDEFNEGYGAGPPLQSFVLLRRGTNDWRTGARPSRAEGPRRRSLLDHRPGRHPGASLLNDPRMASAVSVVKRSSLFLRS